RVALATTHLPLRAVSDAITVDSLLEAGVILARELKRSWAIPEPRIAVCGLNPHAGEGGYLGDEELRVITPAIERMRSGGIRACGVPRPPPPSLRAAGRGAASASASTSSTTPR